MRFEPYTYTLVCPDIIFGLFLFYFKFPEV